MNGDGVGDGVEIVRFYHEDASVESVNAKKRQNRYARAITPHHRPRNRAGKTWRLSRRFLSTRETHHFIPVPIPRSLDSRAKPGNDGGYTV